MNMMNRTDTELGLRGVMRLDEPMDQHTSWRAGGKADRAYVPADRADLIRFVQSVPAEEPLYMVGLGSNLLVRDGGFRGTMVLLHRVLNELRFQAAAEGDGLIYAEAGVAAPKVAKYAAKHSLDGAEFLAGIPGTVGGALAMNAGCYGVETWDCVVSVSTLSRSGALRERSPEDYSVGYRNVALAHSAEEEWFVSATFKFAHGDAEQAESKIKELLNRRIASQPLSTPNAGSVFRNPERFHAARLIEASGLKGFAIGDAQVSTKHANFIVNLGEATATEIEKLIFEVRRVVQKKQGILLTPEVRIVGEPLPESTA